MYRVIGFLKQEEIEFDSLKELVRWHQEMSYVDKIQYYNSAIFEFYDGEIINASVTGEEWFTRYDKIYQEYSGQCNLKTIPIIKHLVDIPVYNQSKNDFYVNLYGNSSDILIRYTEYPYTSDIVENLDNMLFDYKNGIDGRKNQEEYYDWLHGELENTESFILYFKFNKNSNKVEFEELQGDIKSLINLGEYLIISVWLSNDKISFSTSNMFVVDKIGNPVAIRGLGTKLEQSIDVLDKDVIYCGVHKILDIKQSQFVDDDFEVEEKEPDYSDHPSYYYYGNNVHLYGSADKGIEDDEDEYNEEENEEDDENN